MRSVSNLAIPKKRNPAERYGPSAAALAGCFALMASTSARRRRRPTPGAAPPPLMPADELPSDVLALIVMTLTAEAALALGQCSWRMRVAVDDDLHWQHRLRERHEQVLAVFFEGKLPPMPLGFAKDFFFGFDESWLQLAQQHTGRLLLRMRVECELSCPRYYGVPWHLAKKASPEGCGGGALRAKPGTHIVYDVTSFAPHHPGAVELLAAAAAVPDATDFFDGANHSERARRMLRQLAVPGLERVPAGAWRKRSPGGSAWPSCARVPPLGALLHCWGERPRLLMFWAQRTRVLLALVSLLVGGRERLARARRPGVRS